MNKIFIRQSPALLFFKLIILIIVFDLIIFLSSIASDYLFKDFGGLVASFMEYDTFIVLILIILQIFVSILLLLDWYKHFYVIEGNQITWKRGMLFSRETIFIINLDMNLVTEQNYFERLLEYGNIQVKMNTDQKFVIHGISNPDLLSKKLQESMVNSKVGSA